MLRKGRWKYHEYVGFEPELFDVDTDAHETTNRAGDPSCSAVVAEMRAGLRRIIDPEAADRQAKADQRALVDRFGGRDVAFRMGTEGATPVPDG
jgi:choline-sulfatase